jgi:hypothetical protein
VATVGAEIRTWASIVKAAGPWGVVTVRSKRRTAARDGDLSQRIGQRGGLGIGQLRVDLPRFFGLGAFGQIFCNRLADAPLDPLHRTGRHRRGRPQGVALAGHRHLARTGELRLRQVDALEQEQIL